jgi:2-oxoglutarate ferredoxin oxidoreductase subunit alpha
MIGGCDAAVREAARHPPRAGDRGGRDAHPRIPIRQRARLPHAVTSTFVIEQNRDAQLRALLAIELGVAARRHDAVLDYGGMPLTAKVVVDAVKPT